MRVVVSAAMSLDGRIDDARSAPLVLSGPDDLAAVYDLRADCDAILVGAGTLRADDPQLLIRGDARVADRRAAGRPAQLDKVVLSESGVLPVDARLFAERETTKWIVTAQANAEGAAAAFPDRPDIRILGLDALDPAAIHAALAAAGIEKLFVEGGRRVLTDFLSAGVFDELRVAIAPFFVGDADAPRFVDPAVFANDPDRPLRLIGLKRFGDVAALTYRRSA